MTIQKFKYIFIGAGTASLAAANRLLDLGETNFLILEKGNSLSKRHCPGVKKNNCAFCSAGCFVTEGIGGSNALNGNKICYFPASDHIQDYFDSDIIQDSMMYLDDVLYPYYDNSLNRASEKYSVRKSYNSDVLNREHFSELIGILTERLFKRDILKFNLGVRIVEKLAPKNFEIVLDNDEICYAENVIVGIGRTSYNCVRNIFENLGVKYKYQNPDIGFRIETDKNNFNENYYYQVDPKYKYIFKNLGIGRTFCAHNQGFITPVQYGQSFFADGAFGDEFGTLNNIALMIRLNQQILPEALEEWCHNVNLASNNSLLLGSISLYQNSSDIIEQILSIMPIYINSNHKKATRLLLEKIMLGRYKLINNHIIVNSKINIYGPAIDLYWPKPYIGRGLTSNIDNLFFIGDASGISRGYGQAMFSGVAWANSIISNKKITRKSKRVWSISV